MELDEEETIAVIAGALTGLGHTVERIGNGTELARRLARGERWDLVLNIAEGLRGRSREAQVPALCEMFDQPCSFSDPLTCALTLDKPLAKRLVHDHGLPTAPFCVIERTADVEAVDLAPPLFIKPAAEGSSKGVTARSRIDRREDLRAACAELLRRASRVLSSSSFAETSRRSSPARSRRSTSSGSPSRQSSKLGAASRLLRRIISACTSARRPDCSRSLASKRSHSWGG